VTFLVHPVYGILRGRMMPMLPILLYQCVASTGNEVAAIENAET